jgi:hypothetical protein
MALIRSLPRRPFLSPLLLAVAICLLALALWSALLPGVASATTPRPTVTGLSPSSGPTCWGPVVTITGTGFTGAATVRIGKLVCYHFTVVSSTKITLKMPPQSAGTRDVQVTTAGGRSLVNSHDQYTYRPRPTVTGLSAHSGSTKGGNLITITGTGFSHATSVRFGLVRTTHFTVVSSTKITVKVPAQSAGTHDVEVTTSGGRSHPNSHDKYTYK